VTAEQLGLLFGPPPDARRPWFTISRRRLLRWAAWSRSYRNTCCHPEAFHDWLDPAWLAEHTHPAVVVRVVGWTEGGDEATRVVRVELEDRQGRTGGAWLVVPAALLYDARTSAAARQ
jgi:hypothetical protein